MAEPILIDNRREIYEGFWRQGLIPLTKSIRVVGVGEGGHAKVAAVGYEIPAEVLVEHTVESLQQLVDATAEPPVMVCPN